MHLSFKALLLVHALTAFTIVLSAPLEGNVKLSLHRHSPDTEQNISKRDHAKSKAGKIAGSEYDPGWYWKGKPSNDADALILCLQKSVELQSLRLVLA